MVQHRPLEAAQITTAGVGNASRAQRKTVAAVGLGLYPRMYLTLNWILFCFVGAGQRNKQLQ